VPPQVRRAAQTEARSPQSPLIAMVPAPAPLPEATVQETAQETVRTEAVEAPAPPPSIEPS
jgi:hypothetical protein